MVAYNDFNIEFLSDFQHRSAGPVLYLCPFWRRPVRIPMIYNYRDHRLTKYDRHYDTVPLTNLAFLPKVRYSDIREKLNADPRETNKTFNLAPIRGGDLLHLDAFHYQDVLSPLLPSTLEHPHVYIMHLRSNSDCYSVHDCNLVDLLPAVHSASCILESNSISGG